MKSLIHIKIPNSATFISDLHGKPFILKKIFKDLDIDNKLKYENHIVFILGDFLDRGSIVNKDNKNILKGAEELFDIIIEYKEKYPEQFIVLFGNHEFLHFKQIFNKKFNIKYTLYENNILRLNEKRLEFFSKMTFAVIAKKKNVSVFVSHSGIPVYDKKLSSIIEINKNSDIIDSSIIKELLFNQPDWLIKTGKRFSKKTLKKFLDSNKLFGAIRGHSVHNRYFKIGESSFLINFHTTFGPSNDHSEHNKYYYVSWDKLDKFPKINLKKI